VTGDGIDPSPLEPGRSGSEHEVDPS